MAQTTTTQVDPAVDVYYNRLLLKRLLPHLAHHLFGQQKPVPMKSGTQPKFRKYSSLTKATTPITEGQIPTAQQMSKTDITGQLEQYGSYVEVTDKVEYVVEDANLTEATELIAANAGESLDEIYREALVAGTNVFYANSVAGRTSIITGPAEADFDLIVRGLKDNKAKPWKTQPIYGTPRVGSVPIGASYYAIIDAYAEHDISALTNFVPVQKYPDGGKSAMENEIGAYKNLRFVMTTEAKVWESAGGSSGSGFKTTDGTNWDVHTALIFGQNAYGICPLEGKAIEHIFKSKAEAGGPLEQFSTTAWKAMTDCLILEDAAMYRYEFAVSE